MILRQVGPPVMCDHQMTTKLFICRKQGPKLQAPVLALPDEPRPTMLDVCLVSDPALLGPLLPGERDRAGQCDRGVRKSGNNPYQKKEVCTICGKVLLLEKTALGIQKEQERVKQKQQPSYQEYLEWKDRVHWSRAASGQTMAQTGHRGHVTDRR